MTSDQMRADGALARGLADLGNAEPVGRLSRRRRRLGRTSSRSYVSIVRANVLTVFNLIIAGFGGVTLIFGDPQDLLFLGVVVANSGIGIAQEVRAKRALDRLSLLVAARATVQRDGVASQVDPDEVLLGDLVLLAPGDQLVADGVLVTAHELGLDEAVLTGESEPRRPSIGEDVHSGAFAVEGTGTYRVTAVGEESFAGRVTGQARSFRHPRSPLERAVNRMLYATVALVLGLGALLGYSLHHRAVGLHMAVTTSTAGVVTLIPDGLMVLVSLTYAAAAVRMSRRGVLAQQLNAIESLASVDTICIDKTGTLTEGALRVVEIVPAAQIGEAALSAALGVLAASASARNITLRAIADAYPAEPQPVLSEVPFSSRRRWSAAQLPDETLFIGAPGRIPVDSLAGTAHRHQEEGRRVLAIARGFGALPLDAGDEPPEGLVPLGLVVLAEELRPCVAETIAFLREEGIEIKVLSGDDPNTVAAIARDVGIPVTEISQGSEIPQDPDALRSFATRATVVGRISPEGKQAIVRALCQDGRYVAMIGDGVNDVPALKASRLAIAQGSGTQMARSVSDLVLVSGDFAAVPPLIAEGRQALRNLQRVAKLYLTKSAFAAFLIVTVGLGADAYPLLPRQLSLGGGLAIAVPTFFLALAPSRGPWRPDRFATRVARFAVPAGVMTGTAVISSYLFALHSLDRSVADARTVALTAFVVTCLYLVMALEAGGSRRRSALVAGMCGAMALLYVASLFAPLTRHFFALQAPDVGMVATALLASAVAIWALMLCGFAVRGAPLGDH
ncbi:MAG TPA: HAD-IC family P-type ATPase [Solirubrobacteraceae bacterium]|nr:HAD-IC family P-type ATPase [Solirubrobacteraceae bacterium]